MVYRGADCFLKPPCGSSLLGPLPGLGFAMSVRISYRSLKFGLRALLWLLSA